jgi:hypothetical protein
MTKTMMITWRTLFLWEHRRHTEWTTPSRDSFGGIYLNANQWQHEQGQNSRTSRKPTRMDKTAMDVAMTLGNNWNVAVTI